MAHTEKDINGLHEPVILALETATMCGSVAIVTENRCVAEFSLQTSETHSRRLLAGVDWLLHETALEWPDIDAVAVSLGPGSFTGLRIGLATAKGLAMSAGAKLIGVGTLDGMAAQFSSAEDNLICPVLDARKKEVYCGIYRCDNQGFPRIQGEYQVVSPEALCERINEPVVLLGDGTEVYGHLFREKLAGLLRVAPPGIYFPRAATIGLLALAKWQKKEFLDPATAEPIYIRPSEAELLFRK
jgi:tRNA threonylcarbamoyladenosine biosynthesis protein TsaB